MARQQKLNYLKTKQIDVSHIFDDVVLFVRNLLIGIIVGFIGLALVFVWWLYA